jgi:hypothetical protein
MRIVLGAGLGLAVFIGAACADHSAPQQASAPPAHWTAKVCTSLKDTLTLQSGPSQDDSESFATWRSGDGQMTYGLPARVQQLTQVYVNATGVPEGKEAQVCLRFDGHSKKAFNFSGHDESHLVKSSDSDDSSCHC